jgi:predicted flap endonuclease-1-like 5' DNA nuclease
MGFISAIKSVLGMGDSDSQTGGGSMGTSVTVERETDATSERAVKQSDAAATGVEDDPETATDEESDQATEDDPETVSGSDDDESGAAEDGVAVGEIRGIGPAYGERLADAGVHTVSDLAAADPAELSAATGIAEGRIEGWIDRATDN